jgi:hypothetical protein
MFALGWSFPLPPEHLAIRLTRVTNLSCHGYADTAHESSDTSREGHCNIRRSNKRRENGGGRGLKLPPTRRTYFSTGRDARQHEWFAVIVHRLVGIG